MVSSACLKLLVFLPAILIPVCDSSRPAFCMMYSACEWGEWKSFSHGKLFVTPIYYRVHEILQARILEWVAVPFSRASSQPREQTQVSHIAGRFFTSWATRKLNKQDDNIQPCCTPFPILNQSIVPCLVLIVAPWPTKVSWETGKVVWYSHMLKNFPVCCDPQSQSI